MSEEQDNTVSKDEIDRVDKEIKAKEAEAKKLAEEKEAERKTEINKLLDEAQDKGKDAALKEFEDEQTKKKLAEENEKLRQELTKSQEETKKTIEDIKKETEDRFKELEARRKGMTRNDSPFKDTQSNEEKIEKTPEEMKDIDVESRKALLGW